MNIVVEKISKKDKEKWTMDNKLETISNLFEWNKKYLG